MRRRAPLLALGRRAFAERPYADVAVEDIAERAGASRTLLPQIVPLEVARRAVNELARLREADSRTREHRSCCELGAERQQGVPAEWKLVVEATEVEAAVCMGNQIPQTRTSRHRARHARRQHPGSLQNIEMLTSGSRKFEITVRDDVSREIQRLLERQKKIECDDLLCGTVAQEACPFIRQRLVDTFQPIPDRGEPLFDEVLIHHDPALRREAGRAPGCPRPERACELRLRFCGAGARDPRKH